MKETTAPVDSKANAVDLGPVGASVNTKLTGMRLAKGEQIDGSLPPWHVINTGRMRDGLKRDPLWNEKGKAALKGKQMIDD